MIAGSGYWRRRIENQPSSRKAEKVETHSDSSSIVSDKERNSLGSELDFLDLEELVGSLLSGDSVDGESTFDVVEESEVFTRLLNGDDI